MISSIGEQKLKSFPTCGLVNLFGNAGPVGPGAKHAVAHDEGSEAVLGAGVVVVIHQGDSGVS